MRNFRINRNLLAVAATGIIAAALFGCGDAGKPGPDKITSLSEVPAVRLNFRYEADVPPPEAAAASTAEERNAAVQADFDNTRPQEIIDKTLASPDKKIVAAIYHRLGDAPGDLRIDLYTPEGRLFKKLTSDAMAVRFPESIRWSPDSLSLAFSAATRPVQLSLIPGASPSPTPTPEAGEEPSPDADPEPTPTEALPAATPPAPSGILTFRTEQIYIASADGNSIKPVTNTEGLVYFYYAWSPDNSKLVALASTLRESKYYEQMANGRGEQYVPQGRPRVIEKNGRERRLDDNLTAVWPAWSPDSTKIAAAYGNQIRIYDAEGTNPTQAAIPLRNQLLISSQAYDREQKNVLAADPNTNANTNTAETPLPVDDSSTLPDEKLLVSYNPIVELIWTADELLYFKTAYLKLMMNPGENVVSFARWHRLPLSVRPEEAQK